MYFAAMNTDKKNYFEWKSTFNYGGIPKNHFQIIFFRTKMHFFTYNASTLVRNENNKHKPQNQI